MDLWQTAPEFQTGAAFRHPALQGTERSGDEWHIELRTQDKKNTMDHPVTVTGCVAAGAMAGNFMLTHAMPVDSKMMDKDKMGSDKGRTMPMEMDKHKMAGAHLMSFALKGGTDLKAHLGHKIEAKGTTDKPMADLKPMTGMDARAMKPMVLTVTSVKMISATCPQ